MKIKNKISAIIALTALNVVGGGAPAHHLGDITNRWAHGIEQIAQPFANAQADLGPGLYTLATLAHDVHTTDLGALEARKEACVARVLARTLRAQLFHYLGPSPQRDATGLGNGYFQHWMNQIDAQLDDANILTIDTFADVRARLHNVLLGAGLGPDHDRRETLVDLAYRLCSPDMLLLLARSGIFDAAHSTRLAFGPMGGVGYDFCSHTGPGHDARETQIHQILSLPQFNFH